MDRVFALMVVCGALLLVAALWGALGWPAGVGSAGVLLMAGGLVELRSDE